MQSSKAQIFLSLQILRNVLFLLFLYTLNYVCAVDHNLLMGRICITNIIIEHKESSQQLLNVVADHSPITFIYKIYSTQFLCVPLKLRNIFYYFRNHLVLKFPKWSKIFLNLKGTQRNYHE